MNPCDIQTLYEKPEGGFLPGFEPEAGKPYFECPVCKRRWKWKPKYSECPGVPVYGWGAWGDLLTKKQIYDAGYQTGKKLPPPAGACYRDKSPGGIMWLYDATQAVKRGEITEKQREGLKKAQYNAAVVGLDCARCGREINRYATRKNAEKHAGTICFICRDRDGTIKRARERLADGFLILDTETTGLWDPEPMQIAVIDHHGNVLLNTLVKPWHPERALERGGRNGLCAYDIHGIHPDQVQDAPMFPAVFPKLREILAGQQLVIYNRDFDMPMLESWSLLGVPYPYLQGKNPFQTTKQICAMVWYSEYCGEWWERKEDYRWQSLPGGDHSALGDCLATLAVIKGMAADSTFEEEQAAKEVEPNEVFD